jgi:hypothetical protein
MEIYVHLRSHSWWPSNLKWKLIYENLNLVQSMKWETGRLPSPG